MPNHSHTVIHCVHIEVKNTHYDHVIHSARVLTDNNSFTDAVLFGIKSQVSKALDVYMNKILNDASIQSKTDVVQEQQSYIKETLAKIEQCDHIADILSAVYDFENNRIVNHYSLSCSIDDILVYS